MSEESKSIQGELSPEGISVKVKVPLPEIDRATTQTAWGLGTAGAIGVLGAVFISPLTGWILAATAIAAVTPKALGYELSFSDTPGVTELAP